MMTVEEKARAYDFALLEATRRWESGLMEREELEHMFPEVAESDEVKLIKWMIEHFRKVVVHDGIETNYPQAIEWLENRIRTIDDKERTIEKMVRDYKGTVEDCTNAFPVNCQVRAYRQGIEDAIHVFVK